VSCFNPLKAFEIGTLPSGKKDLKIVPYGVHHLEMDSRGKIIPVGTPDVSAYRVKTFTKWSEIPCGYCEGCRIARSREWANRCMMELEYHKSAYFVTLTYDDDHVPVSYYSDPDTGEAMKSLTLRKRDFQLFMKRLRKAFPDCHIRYYACGEYGSQTLRPHYHAIIYGLELDDLEVYRDVRRGDVGYQYFTSKSLQDGWSVIDLEQAKYNSPCRIPLGYVLVGNVTWETCAYTARYVLKKHYGAESQVYEEFNVEPEFVLMSRRPGIARQWYEDHPGIYEYDSINLSTSKGGMKIRPPKYFDKLFDLEQPGALDEIKEKRKHFAEEAKKGMMAQTNLTYQEFLKVKAESFHNRIKTLKREL
jgi:hypothetical protein